ncbi:hypothetical protein L2728_01985 [Shewanella chilikensis]|uniref:lipopolysaccharide biosynthesis protein n=1 Tax=Shewanella chilikensis TaxID=558541 RepID=UPI00200C1732|nr:oligosaccharide flippase family protein [Shewanella chilikensis]MCL1160663.1 hypothetical protein [Shewanella chilikensis]
MKKFFTYISFNGLSLGISSLSIPILTAILSPVEYARIGLFLSAVALVTPMISMGIETLLQIKINKLNIVEFQIYRAKAVSVSVIVFLFFQLSVFVVFYLDDVDNIYILVPIFCFFKILRMAGAGELVILEKPFQFGISNSLAYIISFLFSVVLLNYLPDALWRVFSLITAEVIILGIFFRVYFGLSLVLPEKKFVIQLLKFGGPLVCLAVPAWVVNEYGKLYVQESISLESVGVFTVGLQIALVFNQFTSALLNTILPKIMKNIKVIFNVKYFLLFLFGLIFSTAVFYFCVLFIGPVIVDVRYNEIYTFIGYLIVGVLFQSMGSIASNYANFYGLTYYRFLALCLGALINMAILIFGHSSSLQDVSLAFMLSMAMYSFSLYLLTYQHYWRQLEKKNH